MRNEVFARHGHRFKTKSIADHFEGQPWYKAQVDDAGPLLTELERKNVALIRQVEKQAKDAQRAQEEKAAQAAWAKPPADVQGFWQKLRGALKSGSPERIAAFVAEDFRDGLSEMLRTGRSQRVGRAAFCKDVSGYLPDAVIKQMLRQSPDYERGVLRFYTGELPDDEVARAGRIYRFRGKDGQYKLLGVYIAAGPGDEG
jgi:hypothetical protein